MAATSVLRAPISDTDANFRLWGKSISDQLAAGGMVQTADTGQINWATVVKPAAISTSQGYEIWRSADGGNNWYLKLEYGSGAVAADRPSLWFTIGWGSDGAGALTTNVNTRRQIAPAIASVATTYYCNLAAGNNWICLSMFTGNASWGFCLSIERTVSSSGTLNDEILWFTSVQSTQTSQVCPRTGALGPVAPNGTYGILTFDSTQGTYGSDVGVCLLFGQKGGPTNPSLNILGGYSSLFSPVQATVTNDAYGATHTFIINATGPWFQGSLVPLLTRFE